MESQDCNRKVVVYKVDRVETSEALKCLDVLIEDYRHYL